MNQRALGGAQGCSAARVRAVAMALGSRMSVAGTSAAVAMGAMYSSRFMESIFSESDSLRAERGCSLG